MNAKDARLLGTQDHRTLAILAADCTEDVLAYFFRGTFGQSCFLAGTRTENVRGEVRIVAYLHGMIVQRRHRRLSQHTCTGRERRGTQLWCDIKIRSYAVVGLCTNPIKIGLVCDR